MEKIEQQFKKEFEILKELVGLPNDTIAADDRDTKNDFTKHYVFHNKYAKSGIIVGNTRLIMNLLVEHKIDGYYNAKNGLHSPQKDIVKRIVEDVLPNWSESHQSKYNYTIQGFEISLDTLSEFSNKHKFLTKHCGKKTPCLEQNLVLKIDKVFYEDKKEEYFEFVYLSPYYVEKVVKTFENLNASKIYIYVNIARPLLSGYYYNKTWLFSDKKITNFDDLTSYNFIFLAGVFGTTQADLVYLDLPQKKVQNSVFVDLLMKKNILTNPKNSISKNKDHIEQIKHLIREAKAYIDSEEYEYLGDNIQNDIKEAIGFLENWNKNNQTPQQSFAEILPILAQKSPFFKLLQKAN